MIKAETVVNGPSGQFQQQVLTLSNAWNENAKDKVEVAFAEFITLFAATAHNKAEADALNALKPQDLRGFQTRTRTAEDGTRILDIGMEFTGVIGSSATGIAALREESQMTVTSCETISDELRNQLQILHQRVVTLETIFTKVSGNMSQLNTDLADANRKLEELENERGQEMVVDYEEVNDMRNVKGKGKGYKHFPKGNDYRHSKGKSHSAPYNMGKNQYGGKANHY